MLILHNIEPKAPYQALQWGQQLNKPILLKMNYNDFSSLSLLGIYTLSQ